MESKTDLKDHANMGSIDAAYLEVIEQLNSSAPERVSFVSLSNALQKLDLVQGGLCVVSRAFHHFQRDEAFLAGRKEKMNKGEEFFQQMISVVHRESSAQLFV